MLTQKEFLSGTLSTLILSLLKENGELYGYQICQLTKERTSNDIALTEGAIYPALHKLEKKGLIRSHKLLVQGRTRKYYAIKEESKQLVNEQINQLWLFTNHIQKILKASRI